MTDLLSPSRIEPIVARLHGLYPRLIDLGLDRLRRLLAQLGHPERRLPPVLHVAGTNGKGSTCAMLRAIGEAAGWRVHVYTSPHLVRFNERIRVAGELVSDDTLAATLERIERVNDGAPITVFEVITAAALVLFAESPAELCVLEVGLGGRGDATNVIERPAACAVTSISLDHQELLGPTVAAIAGEKAGIFKPGAPSVTGAQPGEALAVLHAAAARVGTALHARGEAWDIAPRGDGLRYCDKDGAFDLPRPALLGLHQIDNAGIAVAAMRASGVAPPGAAYAGLADATWPARLQRLRGSLAASVPGFELWLDGGHNAGAAKVLATQLAAWPGPTHLVVGLKRSKDPAAFLAPLLPLAATAIAVREPAQHDGFAPGEIARPGVQVGTTVAHALDQLAQERPAGERILICGSLYLAGEVLKADGSVASKGIRS